MRRWLWVVVAAVLVSSTLLTINWLRSEQGAKLHHFALFNPGEASPFSQVTHRIAFSPLVPPLAAADKFYLLGARRGYCSTEGNQRDPFVLLSLDPATGVVVELPGANAPKARVESRFVAVDDGFLLIGGGKSEESEDCGRYSLTQGSLMRWAYKTFPLDWFYPVDLWTDDFLLSSITPVGPAKPTLIAETYRYTLSRQSWERVPALDLVPDGGSGSEPVAPFDHRLLQTAEARELVPEFGGGPDGYHLDLLSERRVVFPSLETLSPRGIHIENSWLTPSLIDGKLILFFPQGTLSARSAADIQEHNREEREFLAEMPVDDGWRTKLDQLAERVSPHAGLVLDLKAKSWSPINSAGAPWQLPFEEFHGTSAVAEGKLVVFTGETRKPGGIYDPHTDRWKPIARAGAPQFDSVAATTVGDRIAVYDSGVPDQSDEVRDRNIYLFDVEKNQWRMLLSPTGPPIRSVAKSGAELLVLSDWDDRLEWFSMESGFRNRLQIAPHFHYYQFATARGTALVYSVEDLDK